MSAEGNFLVPKLFRFEKSAVSQNWVNWPGQASTNKWAEYNAIYCFKKIETLQKYGAALASTKLPSGSHNTNSIWSIIS